MLFEIRLGWKYFLKGRRRLAGFTSLVAVLGIASGLAGFILAKAIADGFENEIRDKILGGNFHITVTAADGAWISNWGLVSRKLTGIGNVERVTPTSYTSAVIMGKERSAFAVLRVTDRADIDRPEDRTGSEDVIPVIVGKELAASLSLAKGSGAEIVTVTESGSARTSEVRVVGVFSKGLYEFDSTWIYLSPLSFAKLVGQEDFEPPAYGVEVRNEFAAARTAADIRKVLGKGFRVIDWQEANQPLFAALSLERTVALSIISLIVFVAVLNITTTLALLVNRRRSDIAVLRACGASMRKIGAVFVVEGTVLSVAGVVLGLAAGLAGVLLANSFRIVSLPKEVYSLSSVTLVVDYGTVAIAALVTLTLCLAAMVLPVIMISRIKPLENLKQ